MVIFGTRPEAIKMAPLVNQLKQTDRIEPVVCVTAQHRQMLDQVLDIFGILPDFDLNIMQERQTLAQITTRVLEGLDGIITEAKPDMILVHGDTTTTFAGSLAAFYRKIRIGHVEAGLRTFDKYFPYPEEMNRKLTGALADVHFAPTRLNRDNLLNEGVKAESIYVTGNTVIDALQTTVRKDYVFKVSELNRVDFEKKRVITVTAHRRENLGQPLRNICEAIKRVVENYGDTEVVYPVHLNPAVKEPVYEILGKVGRIHLIEPVDVQDMHNLIDRSHLVLTDSGGLQEEAPSLGKPVLVLRNETERPEAVKAGTVKIAGTDAGKIFEMTSNLLENTEEYEKMARAVNPYGDGQASRRIAEALLYEFGLEETTPREFSS